MAIAASFLVSKQLGFTTTIAVIAHESTFLCARAGDCGLDLTRRAVPHEIGDYALLIQSGFSARSAMLLQLVTAVFALVGCVVGLVSAGSGPTAAWILPFTAGGFIYIATVDVLPDLLKETNAKQTALEVAMMVLGVASMVAIANFEASH
jgi:zinc transporter 7